MFSYFSFRDINSFFSFFAQLEQKMFFYLKRTKTKVVFNSHYANSVEKIFKTARYYLGFSIFLAWWNIWNTILLSKFPKYDLHLALPSSIFSRDPWTLTLFLNEGRRTLIFIGNLTTWLPLSPICSPKIPNRLANKKYMKWWLLCLKHKVQRKIWSQGSCSQFYSHFSTIKWEEIIKVKISQNE